MSTIEDLVHQLGIVNDIVASNGTVRCPNCCSTMKVQEGETDRGDPYTEYECSHCTVELRSFGEVEPAFKQLFMKRDCLECVVNYLNSIIKVLADNAMWEVRKP